MEDTLTIVHYLFPPPKEKQETDGDFSKHKFVDECFFLGRVDGLVIFPGVDWWCLGVFANLISCAFSLVSFGTVPVPFAFCAAS